jgi:putative ABC transport system permease protein
MRLLRLAIRNIRGSGFRSAAIFLCIAGIAAFLLATTLIIRGSQDSLDTGIRRLGADIVVVPQGAEDKMETALLMGKPTNVWMPEANLQKIADIQGVGQVSPQVFLTSVYGASCCAVPEMFMVVYDPQTDFTITPWIEKRLKRPLARGEVIGGTDIFVPPGEKGIRLYGYVATLTGNLEPTGTGIDQTLFMTRETAQEIAESSVTTADSPLEFSPGSISAIMVKTKPGADVHRVALQIMRDTSGMFPIESLNLFGAFRSQMNGLLWGFLAITVVIWALAAIMMGVNFSMAANERRREMAVLRAVGATPGFIFRLMLTEAGLLAIGGVAIGIAIAATGLYLAKDALAASLKMPFLFPSPGSLLGPFGAAVGLAVVTVALSALVPALRASRQELAISMRE